MKNLKSPTIFFGVLILVYFIIDFFKSKADAVKNESHNETSSNLGINKTLPKGVIPSTANFNIHEFACKDGTPVPEELYGNIQYLMNQLQLIRDRIGKPIKINSAYRTKEYNVKVGGAYYSQHLKGNAADIVVKGMTPKQLLIIIREMQMAGTIHWGGVGLYDTFIHFDTASKRQWNESKKYTF